MCLTVYNKFPKIAKKDIVCYKILKSFENGDLVSSVRHFPFKLNVRMKPKGIFKILPKKVMDNILGEFVVEEGYFHTFVYPENAKVDAVGDNDKVYECVIPRGTLYFEGFYGLNICSYASKCLIVKKCM